MSRPWMPLYVADYLADTAHLSAAEHGAYLLLIMHYWTKGKLPDDEEAIRRITRLTTRQWSQSRDVLRSLFGDGWCHKRIDEELGKAIEKSKVNSANAQRRHGERTADAERTHTQSQSHLQEEDRIVDARATRSAFTDGSKALSAALFRGLSIGSPLEIPPELAGADWRAIEWERAGWTIDLVEVETRRVGPGKPLNYYEKCFASAFAKRQAPLPIVEIRQAETLTVTHGKPKAGIIQAADNLIAKLAEFDGPARPDDIRSDAGQDPPRLLSHG